jgi:hypothetical protein
MGSVARQGQLCTGLPRRHAAGARGHAMYDEDDPEWVAERQRYRLRRIARFARLVERCSLVSFCAIADWYAHKPGSLERDETRRAQAYLELERAVLNGEFGPPGKPRVAYLPRFPTAELGRLTLRLTAGQLVALREWGTNFVADLWAPRDLCAQWFAARQMIPLPRLAAAADVQFASASANKASIRDSNGRRSGRPLTEQRAQQFARQYFDQEKQAGREPTMMGLEKAVHEAGMYGGRENLRNAFREVMTKEGIPVKLGRRRKPPK